MNRSSSTLAIAVSVSVLLGTVACGHAREPGPTAPTPLTTITLTGHVLDFYDPYEGAGANVEIIDGPLNGTSMTTDENGRFAVTGPIGGSNVTFRVTRKGFSVLTETHTVPARGGSDLYFTPLPNGILVGSRLST